MLKKIVKAIRNPKLLMLYILGFKIFRLIPDGPYLKIKYRLRVGNKLDLNHPKSFNEKLQWLKLYDRRPEYTQLVDKYKIRKYIKETIGDEYLIPLLGVYENFDEINFNTLPDQFVLKCTHDSGGVVICTDKNKFDKYAVKEMLNRCLNNNYFYSSREWPYKNIKPRIVCEKLLIEDNEQSLTDYKFYCFKGVPSYCQVIRDRGKNETIDFYDQDWNHMPFNGLRKLPQSKKSYDKPVKYEMMYKLAQKLSKGFRFIRVDFYYTKGDIYFGELTFYPTSGFGNFYPEEWHHRIGEMINIFDR